MKRKQVHIQSQMGSVSHSSLATRQTTIKRKASELNLRTVQVRVGEIEGEKVEVEQLLKSLGLNWVGFTTRYGSVIVKKAIQA